MNNTDLVLQTIKAYEEPCSISQILHKNKALSRRSVQRILLELIHNKRIHVVGSGRNRRYQALALNKTNDLFPTSIPLSEEAKLALAYVDQPPTARKPTAYNLEFLESYQPNQSWYLSASTRHQLHHMGQTPHIDQPAGTYSRKILGRLLIDLSWASSHLEGNTYSRLDTLHLIKDGNIPDNKTQIETQMILNHKSAIELLTEHTENIAFNRYTLLNLHGALSQNLLPNPSDEARLRTQTVEIGRSTYKPLSVPQKIEEIFDMLLTKAAAIKDPFEQSFFIMVQLPYLQPFTDVNKRTSRLAANIPLMHHNLCPLTFLDVSEKAYSRAILAIYELNSIDLLRDLYVWAYERSSQTYLAIKRDLSDPDPLRLKYHTFIRHSISNMVRENLRPTTPNIAKICQLDISDPHEARQVEALLHDEFRRLHEGNIGRYGLRLSEYQAWLTHQEN